ncbi:MAG: lipoyl synthase [Bryobacteraceae bacterium]
MDLVRIRPQHTRLPEWLRKPQNNYEPVTVLKRDLRRLHLHTVCESARCPNLHECFHRGQATFMLMGNICTRGCGFCSVPKGAPGGLDPAEPRHVAEMAAAMGLRYVVLTSVNRDDLPDGGSAHFAETVGEIRKRLTEARIEVQTPDFCGDLSAVARVLDAGPDVFNHNVETVPRLYRRVRPQGLYRRSLEVLRFARSHRPEVLSKSGLMVGLGEEPGEVHEVMRDLLGCGVDAVTIGQYLQPSRRNLPVERYVEPEQFEAYRRFGMGIGLRMVFSGPFVRSSYMADHLWGDTPASQAAFLPPRG